jgi:hypothetical protein
MPTLVKAPEDLVGWFQDHPYFEVEGLEPITAGGIEGQQFDIVVDVPKDQFGTCGADCLDGAELFDGSVWLLCYPLAMSMPRQRYATWQMRQPLYHSILVCVG